MRPRNWPPRTVSGRPNPDILRRYADRFDLKVKLTKISDFGGWEAAYVKFFNDDALFDKIMADVNGDA